METEGKDRSRLVSRPAQHDRDFVKAGAADALPPPRERAYLIESSLYIFVFRKAEGVMTYVSDATEWAKVGTAVRERMTALGITEDELARKAALSLGTIRGVLRGSGRRKRWTLDILSQALGWPFGYLIAIAEGETPPTAAQTATGKLVRAQRASVTLPASQAAPFAALLSLVDLGHGASQQAETNAMAERLAREMSEGMTQAERIAVHEFLTKVAGKVRWP